jgi:hypothetical protein
MGPPQEDSTVRRECGGEAIVDLTLDRIVASRSASSTKEAVSQPATKLSGRHGQ